MPKVANEISPRYTRGRYRARYAAQYHDNSSEGRSHDIDIGGPHDVWQTKKQCIDEFTSTLEYETQSKTTVYLWFSELNRGRSVLTNELKEGHPKSIVVPQNIDAVRKLMIHRNKTPLPRRPRNTRRNLANKSRLQKGRIRVNLRNPSEIALRAGTRYWGAGCARNTSSPRGRDVTAPNASRRCVAAIDLVRCETLPLLYVDVEFKFVRAGTVYFTEGICPIKVRTMIDSLVKIDNGARSDNQEKKERERRGEIEVKDGNNIGIES
ncbi:hypothetical protein EVAR_17113_1 [Eumeta japonica]|uniref:Mos1 transposase HTH domain-containing protein n=1 Tax=Eumeta variegata TaxID=151549 RepID=A0A4C1ULR7_EUMVA|nr:hypothetical protein EVAR_17113_1 [Eumeta japonica]